MRMIRFHLLCFKLKRAFSFSGEKGGANLSRTCNNKVKWKPGVWSTVMSSWQF